MEVYNFGEIKLHAYQTNDLMYDESYILENKDNVLLVEFPAFYDNLEEFETYVKGLGKNIVGKVFSDHPNGGTILKDVKGYASEGTIKSMKEGTIHNLVTGFETSFGGTFAKEYHEITDVLKDEKVNIGEFVGKLKEEYENELQNIITKCTIPNIFKSEQSKEIIKYVKEKYNDDLEFLWKKFPKNAIWRNKTNNKWYGALLVISERKLEIESDKIVEIIDLRYPKDKIKQVIDCDKIFPGYHMNKESWITIRLNRDMSTKKIFELIDNSHKISLEK